jgi:hypothetical protein
MARFFLAGCKLPTAATAAQDVIAVGTRSEERVLVENPTRRDGLGGGGMIGWLLKDYAALSTPKLGVQ